MFTLFTILNPFTLNRDHTNIWLQSAGGRSSSDQQWWKHQSGHANLHPSVLARCYDATTLKFQMMACKYFSIRLSSRRSNGKRVWKRDRGEDMKQWQPWRWQHPPRWFQLLPVFRRIRDGQRSKLVQLGAFTQVLYWSIWLIPHFAVVFFCSATHHCQVLSFSATSVSFADYVLHLRQNVRFHN